MKRSNWTKQLTILLAAVSLLLAALAGRHSARPGEGYLLQVEGVPISPAVYRYYLAQALSTGDFALDKQGAPEDKKALREDVKRRCAELVAVNSELHNRDRALSQLLKSQVAEQSAYVWRTFGNYYNSVGVDKRTVNAAMAGAAARDQLFRALYDDAESPRRVPEENVQSYFYGNYVAFEGMRVYATILQEDGTERPMMLGERETLRLKLEAFVAACNQNKDAIFAVVASEEPHAATLRYLSPTEMVVRKGSGELPDDAFEKARQFSPDKVTMITVDDYYLIGRGINMRETPEQYYQLYRNNCLWALKGAEYELALKQLYAHYRADENVREVDRLLREWPWVGSAHGQSPAARTGESSAVTTAGAAFGTMTATNAAIID